MSATITLELTDAQLQRLAHHVAALLEERPEGYLSTEDAARFMGCPTSRVHDLVQLGKLHPCRDGRALRFRKADLVAYLEARR